MASKKNQPLWVMENLPEPPIVNGYWDYGTVWSVYMHRPRFHYWREVGRSTYWALWSYYYWGKKVKRSMKAVVADYWAYRVHGVPIPPPPVYTIPPPPERVDRPSKTA